VRRLIVNADDLGLHPGINRGVLTAHAQGIVTSTSLSPNGAAFDDAVALLRGAPDLDLGVHLTLVAERALSGPSPTLAPDGDLPGNYARLFGRLLAGRIRLADVERELSAQLAHVHDAGLRPSHVDGHQHVHLHPALVGLVLDLCRRFGIRGVRAARRVLPLRGMTAALLSLFAGRAARRFRAGGLVTPDAFTGLAETGRLDEARLTALVARLAPGTTELVCHPGQGDREIAATYPWGFAWDAERDALCSPRVREALAAAQVALVSYRDL
jgi:predicted glycoside hydrolase/deacetylase ChbG (UPF0249 family)